jgi:hypothetical protein
MSRRYWEAWAARRVARKEFRQSRAARSSSRYVPYPPDLGPYSRFSEWLFHEVSSAADRGERVEADVSAVLSSP